MLGRLFFYVLFSLYATMAAAAPGTTSPITQPNCTYQGQTCVDSTPCKVFSGITTCLTGATLPPGAVTVAATCWNYQSTYSCYANGGSTQSTCTALANAGCTQSGSPAVLAVNTANQPTITEYLYQCGQTPLPGMCQAPTQSCVNTSSCINVGSQSICLPGTANMPTGALVSQLASTCFDTQSTSVCVNPANQVNNCTALQTNTTCVNTNSQCIHYAPNGTTCALTEQTYYCGAAQSPQCVTTSSTCSDLTANKVVGPYDIFVQPNAPTSPAPGTIGVQSPSSCWNSAINMTCQTTNGTPINTCTALQTQGCIQSTTPPTCTSQGANGTCLNYQYTYTCPAQQEDMTTQTCVVTPQANGCTALANNASCTLTGGTCNNGTCTNTYQCLSITNAPPLTTTTTTCSGGTQYCTSGGTCFTATNASDNTMMNSVVGQEILRQGTNYSDQAATFFDGLANSCRNMILGNVLCSSCCSAPQPSNASNYNALIGVGASVIENYGSKYVEDELGIQGISTMQSFYSALANTGGQLVGNALGFNAYWSGAVGATAAGFAAGLTINFSVTSSSISFSYAYAGFNPYVAVAILIYDEIMATCTCSQSETQTAMQWDNGTYAKNLCIQIGSPYCSKSVPIIGTCMEDTTTFCCYNSILSRIIEQQGGAQLGVNRGTAQNPNCTGLTAAQMQAIDFSKIDFSEFVASVSQSVSVDSAGIEQQMTTRLNQMQNGTLPTPVGATPNPATNQTSGPQNGNGYTGGFLPVTAQ